MIKNINHSLKWTRQGYLFVPVGNHPAHKSLPLRSLVSLSLVRLYIILSVLSSVGDAKAKPSENGQRRKKREEKKEEKQSTG